jgi:kinesin family protein 5
MLEIYNEKIQDLLNPDNNNLKVKESKLSGVYVEDCSEVYVTDPLEMREVLNLGSKNRTIASTKMNDRSSRSHSIVLMTLHQKNTVEGSTKESRLFFVDLAGSEKVGKTGVEGKQLEEAKNINKSLTALGMVINTLAEGKRNSHVPYRDSKLTRLLQDSIGGNALTTLLIACSMCSYNDKETLSTLRFGQRAKAIKNKAKENIEKSPKELQALLDKAMQVIAKYEEQIQVLTSERNLEVSRFWRGPDHGWRLPAQELWRCCVLRLARSRHQH